MINKDRDSKINNSLQQKAGAKVDQDVSFYLHRELGDANDALIGRTSIPKDISKKLIKAESIGNSIKSIIKTHRVGSILNPNPTLKHDELDRLAHFLNEQHVSTSSSAPKVHQPKSVRKRTRTPLHALVVNNDTSNTTIHLLSN